MSEDFRLSVSKAKTFSDCKKKYKFAYILKLPQKDFSFHTFGKFCHKVLEDFHLIYINGSTEPFNIVMGQCFKDALLFFKDKMTPDLKKEAWAIIDHYLRQIIKDQKNNVLPKILSCEKKFEIQLYDNLILNGVIDRIQIDADNVLHVADYKTTKNKKYLKNDWFQLATYAYILFLENPDLEKIRTSYILLRHNFEYVTKEFVKEDMQAIADKYLDYANSIKSETVFPPTTSMLCQYCSFLEQCDEGRSKVNPSTIYGEVSW